MTTASTIDGQLVAAVERKSLADLVSSLINGKLRYALGDLAALAACGRRCRGSLLVGLQARPSAPRRGRRRARRAGRALAQPCRSSSPRPASWPRNGPTATSPPPTLGPAPNSPSPNGAAATRSNRRRQRLPARRSRQPAKSAHGHITKEQLDELIATDLAACSENQPASYARTTITPEKWRQSPWSDEGGGFWVLAVSGAKVPWYNDIEEGFNVSRFVTRTLDMEAVPGR